MRRVLWWPPQYRKVLKCATVAQTLRDYRSGRLRHGWHAAGLGHSYVLCSGCKHEVLPDHHAMLVREIVEPVGLVRALAADAHRIEVRTQQSAKARFEQTARLL